MTNRHVIVQLNGVPLAFTHEEIATAKRRAREMAQRDISVPTMARIGIGEVQRRTGLCRSSIYAHVSAGDFPRQLVFDGRRRRAMWNAVEVAAWVRDRALRRPRSASITTIESGGRLERFSA
jgi:predicted DNA-binding transcriptional regulator AlpA